MKIYNKGEREFHFHELKIKPGVNTVPDSILKDEAKKAGLEKVLADYPDELVDGEKFLGNPGGKDALVASQAARIKELEAQVKGLQRIASATSAAPSALADPEPAQAEVPEVPAAATPAPEPKKKK